jgi:hypothetical protein
MTKLRYLRVAGFSVGAAAVALAAIWVTAAAAGYNVGFRSPSSSSTQVATTSLSQAASTPSAVCTDFVNHFASNLNSDPNKVSAAFQKAVGQTLDDEVKNGTLTQAQADAIKAKIAGKAPCSLIPTSTIAPHPGTTIPKVTAYAQALISAAASALGITSAQLQADLAKGMTLSEIAAAEKPAVTEATFRAKLVANLTPLLDKAVAAKQLTAAQEQAIVHQLQTGTIPYWSKPTITRKTPAATPPVPATTT